MNTRSERGMNDNGKKEQYGTYAEPRCPIGHMLCPLKHDSAWYCDNCGSFEGVNKSYGCEVCNYDICSFCYSKTVRRGVFKNEGSSNPCVSSTYDSNAMSHDELRRMVREKFCMIPPYLRKYYGKKNIVFDPDTESIVKWTSVIKPSDEKIFSLLNTEWICVRNPNEDKRYKEEDNSGEYNSDEDEKAFCAEEYDAPLNALEQKMNFLMPSQYKAAVHECVKNIQEIAIRQKVTVGKWLVFENPELMDNVWSKVAKATVEGSLGHAAKVSPFRGARQGKLVICVYAPDFTDLDRVSLVLRRLLEMGFKVSAGFKPDVYTLLGIYSNHHLGIPHMIHKPLFFRIKDEFMERGKSGRFSADNRNFPNSNETCGICQVCSSSFLSEAKYRSCEICGKRFSNFVNSGGICSICGKFTAVANRDVGNQCKNLLPPTGNQLDWFNDD